MNSPVFITGVGIASPLGTDFDSFSERLLDGQSGVRPVSRFPADQHPSQIAGEVDYIPCPVGYDPGSFERLLPLEKCVLWTVSNALHDAGWWHDRHNPRIGLILGIGAEWMQVWETDSHAGGNRVLTAPHAQPQESMVAWVAEQLHLTGPRSTVAIACASGNLALGLAREWIRMGWVDVCLAGACDMAVTPLCLAAFGNLRTLSRKNSEPETASRPFDVSRDGMVLGEGGATFVLERTPRFASRVYGELAGFGASNDAHHLVIPNADPTYGALALATALRDARLNVSDIDYINAHATGTVVGDECEARILQSVLGDHVSSTPVSSTKSMMGHLVSAAAAVEAAACLAALRAQALPPTINLANPDPKCPLRHVPQHAQPARIKSAVSNSFGFGGNNTSIVLKCA